MNKIVKDDYGVKLKFPERSCNLCKKYPCFDGIENASCDYAKYGCNYWSNK